NDSIAIITRSMDDTVFIEIHDTGIGIPEEAADKLFEPFFTTKEVGRGTGLGLSISYGIVKESSGVIQVEPKKGGGTVFSISFPVLDASEEDLTYENHIY
ncbi:MAG TPA: HAMP domain-containing histidine kinase, partial [Desulfobacterales bacterium]|nr:HAMP domain-containing histidine kinase [Desulfobacterales bacterium]